MLKMPGEHMFLDKPEEHVHEDGRHAWTVLETYVLKRRFIKPSPEADQVNQRWEPIQYFLIACPCGAYKWVTGLDVE